MAQWQLQDSPIFWFVGGVVPPPPGPHVLTSYESGLFPGDGINIEDIAKKLTPEQEHKIWYGDRRYYPTI